MVGARVPVPGVGTSVVDGKLGGPQFAIGHGESGFQNGDPGICFQASAAVARDLSLASSLWSSSNLKCSAGLIGQCQIGGRVEDADRSPFSSEWAARSYFRRSTNAQPSIFTLLG